MLICFIKSNIFTFNVYRKNGDTCLHEAASYNSWNCLVIISSFVGSELFQMRNREGLRAIDKAEKLKNFECY